VDHPQTANAQQLKQQLETLVQLQSLDIKMQGFRQDISIFEQQENTTQHTVESKRLALDKKKKDVEELLKERREAERTVKERQDQISKLSGQLYEVKTNDAYHTLQNEIQTKKQDTALLEERILEMMMAEDDMNRQVKDAMAALKNAEHEADTVHQEHRQQIGVIEQKIQSVQSEWDVVAQHVLPEYLDRYRRLRDAKQGQALAKIENNVCLGCRLTIRPQAVIELQKYRSLLFCDNCARILYVE
jgi:uncharacterized protein